MARMTKPLTNTEVNNAKPKEKNYKLIDGNGLFLLVKSNDVKNWRFRYKRPITNKENEISLGNFPSISLAQARDMRDEFLTLIAQGIDPKQHREQLEKNELSRVTNTFKSVSENWKENKAGKIKDLTLKKYWGIIENYLFPILANYPISDVTPALAKKALEIPYQQGKAEMYRKSVKLLNSILNYAVYSLFLIPLNPCVKIATAFEPPKRDKNPSIKPDELPEFLYKLNNSNTDLLTRYLIQWQLLTMVRPNEAVTAEWTDIDEDKELWVIPAHKMKQTKANENIAHIVPLSKQALSLLKKIKSLSSHKPYLFYSSRAKDGYLNSQTANKAIRDNMGYRDRQTAHGMRKIASTYLHEKGVMPDVIEICLAHAIKGIRGVYNEAEYIPQRKDALQMWGNFIEQCQLKAVEIA